MKKELKNPRREDGAILVIGLVLLLIMTILGISSMNTASLELSMAGNDQYFENAFQLAESGIDTTMRGLQGGTPLPAPLNPGVCPGFNPAVDVPVMGGNLATRICFADDIPDLSGASSIGKIRQYHYVTESQGLAQDQASSYHHQGMFIRGPDGL
ncbi:MAG: pilus assembly PilX family protein [Gammaproteobacteria bacterium]